MYDINKITEALNASEYVRNSVQTIHLAVLKNVYLWMTLALAISGLTS